MTPYPVPLADLMRRRPLTRMSLDAEGVPVYDYRGPFNLNGVTGPRRNKVLIAWWALAALERGDRPEFERLARWMEADLEPGPGGALGWYFHFPYAVGDAPAVQPPFTGAQALGLGLSVLARAGLNLERARRVLPLFDLPSSEGGVLHRDADGELFGVQGAEPCPAVFDGIAFAAIGLKDVGEEALFLRVAECLRRRIARWDCHGGWTRMWIGGPACSAFYHGLNARTARALAGLTGWPELARAADRWEGGLASPAVRARGWVAEKLDHLKRRHA